MISVCFKNQVIRLNYWSSLPIDGARPYILIFHALTGNSNANEWWDIQKLYRKYCCICFTIPSSPYHEQETDFSISEECEIIFSALQKLKIHSLKSVLGGSLGGFYALEFAYKFPDFVQNCIAMATAIRASDWLLCWNEIQRQALLLPNGMALARMIAMMSYRSPQAFDSFENGICNNRVFSINDSKVDISCREDIEPAEKCVVESEIILKTPNEKYLDEPHPVSFSSLSYLHYQAYKFNARFKQAEYLKLLANMDRYRLNGEILIPTLSIAFSTDILFPPHHVQQIQKSCSHSKSKHFDVLTEFGHDGFLVEPTKFIDEIIRFLK